MAIIALVLVGLLILTFIPGLAVLIAGLAKRRRGRIITGCALCAPLLLCILISSLSFYLG